MGPQGAVEIVYRRELQQAADPAARRAELVAEYTERYANPYAAAERGYVDDVIDPADTRSKLIAGLAMLRTKREELPAPQAREHAAVTAATWGPPDGSHASACRPRWLSDVRRSAGPAKEAAVIVAAVEALWPRPVVVVAPRPERHSAWRFSGRWWARPSSARRPRPWV